MLPTGSAIRPWPSGKIMATQITSRISTVGDQTLNLIWIVDHDIPC